MNKEISNRLDIVKANSFQKGAIIGFLLGYSVGIIMLVIVNIIHKYVLLGGTF